MSASQPSPQTIGQALTDGASFSQAIFQRVGMMFNAIANEFLQCLQFICAQTSAVASYEKCGLIVQGEQRDPSTNTVLKDAVAISGSVDIAGGNQLGRAWGGYSQAGSKTGSDGLMIGHEIGLNNNGVAEPNFGQVTSKTALALVAGEAAGNKPVTAAGMIEGGTTQFFNGWIAERSAFVDQNAAPVFAVRDTDGNVKFGITANGDVKGNDVSALSFSFPFVNADDVPNIPPGRMVMWGNTKTGETKLLFFDGGHFFAFTPTVIK
jgi:hypothetical protein